MLFQDNRGFTLVELMISMAIMVAILAAAYTVHLLGEVTYDKGIVQSNLQYDTQKITEYITLSIRAADEVEILADAGAVPAGDLGEGDDNNYLYTVYSPGNNSYEVVLKNKFGVMPIVRYPTQKNSFTLAFAKDVGGEVLQYAIHGTSKNQRYNLDTKVKLKENSWAGSLTSGQVLRFQFGPGTAIPPSIAAVVNDGIVALMGPGNREVNPAYNKWELQIFYGGLDPDDVGIIGLPAGFGYDAQFDETTNRLYITVSGTAVEDIDEAREVTISISSPAIDQGEYKVKLVPNPVQTAILAMVIDDADAIHLTGPRTADPHDAWEAQVLNAVLRSGLSADDIEFIGLPSGFIPLVTRIDDSIFKITLTGTAAADIEEELDVQLRVLASAVEGSFSASEPITVKLIPAPAETAIMATAIDDTIGLIWTGYRTVDQNNNEWKIRIQNAALRSGLDRSDIEWIGLPAGFTPVVDNVGNDTLRITLTESAQADILNNLDVRVRVLPSAVVESGFRASDWITVRLIRNPISEFINYVTNEGVFVYGSNLSVSGSTSVSGSDSTIVVQSNGTTLDFKTSNTISVQAAYIGNKTMFSSSTKLGQIGVTDLVYITNDVLLNNGSASINADRVFITGDAIFNRSDAINAPSVLYIQGDVAFNNGGKINAGQVFIDGDVTFNHSAQINASMVHIKGNVTLTNGGDRINADKVFIDGSVTYTSSAQINAQTAAYIKGNLQFGNWSALLSAPAYYIGGTITLIQPGNISGTRITTLESPPASPALPEFPTFNINNSLRPDAWYAAKGYVSGGSLADNIKIFSAGTYSFNNWQTFNNVVIVSKGDINLTGWITVSGVLFAPYGKITFEGARFEGVAIARDGVYATNGGSVVIFKNISNYFSSPDDYPF